MQSIQDLVLVTGASGFLGSQIIHDLLKSGAYRVRGTVRDVTNEAKVSFLRQLENANHLLELVNADLETADYVELMKDVKYVIHTATPFIHHSSDPENFIVKPAVQGTLSVLKAAAQTKSVVKVVVTSSCGTVVNSIDPTLQSKPVYDESDWNQTTTITNGAYFYSKIQAEKAAWEFYNNNIKNTNDNNNHFELTVINPSLIFGPSISPNLSSSLQFFKNIVVNKVAVPTWCGIVDVRDVSKAHIQAIQPELASKTNGKRIIVASEVIKLTDIGGIVSEQYPNTQFGTPTNTQLPPVKVNQWKFDTSVATNDLNIHFIDVKTSIKDTISSLQSKNVL